MDKMVVEADCIPGGIDGEVGQQLYMVNMGRNAASPGTRQEAGFGQARDPGLAALAAQ